MRVGSIEVRLSKSFVRAERAIAVATLDGRQVVVKRASIGRQMDIQRVPATLA